MRSSSADLVDTAGVQGARTTIRRMELTPELFEKTEFAERRKGYDIDQVETFMEQAGTALAQMLARVRHTEERAAHAESRLAQADAAIAAAQERVQQAEQRMQQAERAAQQAAAEGAGSRADEAAEVEQAAKTLLMAKRTAEATVNEARGHAQSVLEEAQTRSQRQLDEAHAESQELLRRATEQAEAEFADRRAEALDEVEHLELRRSQLSDVIAGLESRLAGYREELGEVAADLTRLAEDPARLGARPAISLLPDEVISAEPDSSDPDPQEPVRDDATAPQVVDDAGTNSDDPGGGTDEVVPADQVVEDTPGASEPTGDGGATASGGPSGASPTASATVTTQPEEDLGGATAVVTEDAYVDLTRSGQESTAADDWGPGSWAQVEAQLADEPEDEMPQPPEPDDRPTEAVSHTGVRRDRYMEELDSAVNEAVDLDDDAMKAFFEGSTDTRARRFGWRR